MTLPNRVLNRSRELNRSRQLNPEGVARLDIPDQIVNPSDSDFTGQAMVTFSYDDGINNNHTLALPLHEKYGVPCTFNIIAGRAIDPSFHWGFFNRFRIRDCHRRKVDIGAHSYYHDAGLPTKSDSAVHFEFYETNKYLKSVIGEDVQTVAMPFSQYDERVKAIARQYYKAVRVGNGTMPTYPPTDVFQLNTGIALENTTTFAAIKTAIDNAVTNKRWIIIMLHSIEHTVTGTYENSTALLEQVLQYVTGLGKSQILAVNSKDGLKFATR